MRSQFICALFVIVSFNLLQANDDNNYSMISGQIVDAHSGVALVGANIVIENSGVGAATDKQGYFTLDVSTLKPGKYSLRAYYVGYHHFATDLVLPLKNYLELNIQLKESPLSLDQIVVTGTRSERMLKHAPVTTQVIKESTIKETGATDLADVLMQVTGAAVTNNVLGTGVSTVDLQGLGSEHVMILVDGVKMIGRVEGQLDVSQIPVSQIQRIEIVKGATSTLYGSEAMGGVVNIITNQPTDTWKFNSSVQFGSYGKLNGDMSVNGSLGGWQPVLSMSYRKYDGFDLDNSTIEEDGTQFDKYQAQLKLKRALSEDLDLRVQTQYFEEEQSIVSSEVFKDVIYNDNSASRVELDYTNNKYGHLKAGLEFSAYDHQFNKLVRSSGFVRKGSETKERLLKGELLFDRKYGDHSINGGYAFELEKIESDRVTGKERNNDLHNFFVQEEYKYSNLLTFLLGLRLDIHSVYGEQYTPKISTMISPTYNTRLRFSYGKGFRAPSFKELYIDFSNLSLNYYAVGNENLKPEKSDAFNAGLEYWTENNYHTRINFFYNHITNLIEYQFFGINDGIANYRSENILGAETWGAEWDMEFYPYEWLEIATGYHYLNSYNDSTKTALELKPKHSVNFRIKMKVSDLFTASVNSQIFSRKFYLEGVDIGKPTKTWIEGFYVINTNISVPVADNLVAQIGVKNITDYVNTSWGPMPGREFYGGLNFNL